MVKKICLMMMMVMNSVAGFGQAPGWVWAKSAGGTQHDAGRSIAVDGDGYLYVTGTFLSPLIIFGTDTLTNAGMLNNSTDIFIVKYDPMGNVIWAQSAGGSTTDLARGIAVDVYGNIYLTGSFAGTATFDSITLTAVGGMNFFLAKYNSAGHVLWVQNAGLSIGYGIAIDAAGNAYVTGYLGAPVTTFGTISLTNTNNYYSNVFTVKYDPLGNALWAKASHGQGVPNTNATHGNSIAVDGNGNSYITGYFQYSTITFDSITFLNNNSYQNMFLVKYDSSGNVMWSRSPGGFTANAMGNGVSVDAHGGVYLTGDFQSDTLALGNINLIKTGNAFNPFIAKYDGGGNVVWAKSGGGDGSQSLGIVTSANGNSYITGFFGDSLHFGNNTLTNLASGADIFVAKFDSSGTAMWAKDAYGRNTDVSLAITVNASSEVYITGQFQHDTLTFGTTGLISYVGSNYTDVFVAKLSYVTGIYEPNSFSNSIKIFPNPSTSHFTINSQTIINQIEITNMLGQVIYRAKPKDKRAEVVMKDAGIYFVSVIAGEERVVRKVVVE